MAPRKKVFVTGASSQLLQEVIQRLNPEEFQVSGLTRNKTQSTQNIEWLIGDLQNPESFKHALNGVDVIIHGAALTHSKNEADYFRVNVEGTENLLSAIPKEQSPLFVFISSRVAGNQSGGYGKSKLLAEEKIKHTAKRWLILRPSEVFGGAKSEGIDNTIKAAQKGGIVPCPVGLKSKMYPIHQTDAANRIYQLVFDEVKLNETIYINGPDGYTYRELIAKVAQESDSTVTPVLLPKIVMRVAAFASTIVNLGFVPDQVPRLYSKKKHGKPSKISITLQEYIREITSQ